MAKMTRPGIRLKHFAEAAAVTALLLVQFHFLSERINFRSVPSGDEGSWMSVAAQLCRGEGFTTRWLEHPFLVPYSIPRPDDYRYPGLSLVLAVSFKLFGISYHTALWTVGVIAMLWTMAVFCVCRAYFGPKTAFITMTLMVVSLLQLEWNTLVYSEGLFGLFLTLLMACSIKADFRKMRWWIAVGALTGLLYLVRPNAILFLVGLVPLAFSQRNGGHVPWKAVAASLGAFCLTAMPWLARNAIMFGNPFHFAGSGGLLRLSGSDPLTFSVVDFVKQYGPFKPLGALCEGYVSFFTDLHFFEHGLEIIPCALVCVALARRQRFYNGFIAAGIALTFVLCCYTEYNAWGGIRYFSSVIPFVYAYGVNELFTLFRPVEHRIAAVMPAPQAAARSVIFMLCACLFLFPVLYPHRFYERKYSAAFRQDFPYTDYSAKLSSLLPGNKSYLADAMAQLNFQWRYNCVGIQFYFDSTDVPRAMETFAPTLAVLTRDELAVPRIQGILRELDREGYSALAADSIAGVTFFTISRRGLPAVDATLRNQ
jgi:hypothetical protein